MGGGQDFRMVTEVPFSEAGSGIAVLLQMIGKGVLRGIEPFFELGVSTPSCMPTVFG